MRTVTYYMVDEFYPGLLSVTTWAPSGDPTIHICQSQSELDTYIRSL